MKKIYNILIVFIFSILLFGCVAPDIVAPSYKVDLTLAFENMMNENIQMVILGTGDVHFEGFFKDILRVFHFLFC